VTKARPKPSEPTPTLSPSDRLGPYEVLGLLGAGGMGEVYRARDARLRRDVALKVLHRSVSLDADHLERLDREARAAGGLNHPNIVAVFDVGVERGMPYVVSELLEGESLRERLDRGPLPYRKALDCGVQIAQALGAAHGKGIYHRDVKPANVFLTEDGRVKLLDFGLAKVRESSFPGGTDDSTAEESRPGVIMGTAGYMAPEQVLGWRVDHRADLFALGAVLYEMFTGARAFQRDSAVETMNAVLKEDPVDPVQLNTSLPSPAAAVVQRCIEKNREERFQSARDLAFHLQQLSELAGAPSLRDVAAARSGRRLLLPVVVAAVLAAVAALSIALRVRDTPTFKQLTFSRGRIEGARFTADGQAVVYSEAREGDAFEVWRLGLSEGPHPGSLGRAGQLLAASAGEIAFSVSRRFVIGERFSGQMMVAPIGSGAPRERASGVEGADWDPSGTHLAVARSTGAAGGQSWIEYPDGHEVYRASTPGSISSPRVSPDGRRIAFLEDSEGQGARGRVAVVDLTGSQRRARFLTEEWSSVRGLAWSPSGREIWFTGADATQANRMLRAVDLEGNLRVLLQAPASFTLWDVAPDGGVLLTRDEERRTLVAAAPGEKGERDLSWFDSPGLAHLTADGRQVLFGDRFGAYLRPTAGSDPIHLPLEEKQWVDDLSPDGRWFLATVDSRRRLVIQPKGAGESRPIGSYDVVEYRGAWWFPDGRRILFTGRRDPDRDLRSFVQNVNPEGPPCVLTPEKTLGLAISPDGEWVAATTPQQPASLWRVADALCGERARRPPPLAAARVVLGSEPDDRPIAWTEDARSIWVFRRGQVPAEIHKAGIDVRRRELWKTVPLDSAGVYSINQFRVTRDGSSYSFDFKRVLSQLYLVRNLE
jgi:hypothetical protein